MTCARLCYPRATACTDTSAPPSLPHPAAPPYCSRRLASAAQTRQGAAQTGEQMVDADGCQGDRGAGPTPLPPTHCLQPGASMHYVHVCVCLPVSLSVCLSVCMFACVHLFYYM